MRSPLAPRGACTFLLAMWMWASSASAERFQGRAIPIVTDAGFPADEFVLSQARFWWDIYVEIGENEGLLHDPFNPDLVLRRVKVPESYGRAGRRAVDEKVKSLQREILELIAKDSAAWTPQERQLKALFPSQWDSAAISLCAERIRFQRGLKNKFRAGLERSYRYLPLIDSIFASHGLPSRLKYLPHVESSFYPHAYSKVGAAGMWQFMKSSSRKVMKVGYLIDERRDPHASTQAAAKMLSYNYAFLKKWPLAVMAYNHGPGGVARAVQGTGSDDLSTIIKSYYSNSFGFASKNFYAEFLAASSIALKADSLFPNLAKMEPLRFQTLVLPKACGTKFLCAFTGLSPEELEEYNLSLRPATFRGNAQLPKGYPLNVPLTVNALSLTQRLGAGETVLATKKPTVSPQVSAAKAATGTGGASATGEEGSSEGVASAGGVTSAVPKAGVQTKAPAEVAMIQGGEDPAPQDKVQNLEAEAPAPVKPEKPRRKPKASAAPGGSGGQEIVAAGAAPESKGRGREAAARDTATMARALASAQRPQVVSSIGVTAVGGPSAPKVVDSNFALQASDLDKLAHPMDRFNPSIYRLGSETKKGGLVIHVGTEETLSHYAEWAFVPEKKLRVLNGIRTANDLRMGRAVRIPVGGDKAGEFLRKREEYYRAIEEDFYNNYYVSGTEPLRVEKGMNLWTWSQDREVPFWLLQKHNAGKALSEIQPGDTLNIPLIETGIRKWGFTRYGNSKEYLAGISRFLLTGKADSY